MKYIVNSFILDTKFKKKSELFKIRFAFLIKKYINLTFLLFYV